MGDVIFERKIEKTMEQAKQKTIRTNTVRHGIGAPHRPPNNPAIRLNI